MYAGIVFLSADASTIYRQCRHSVRWRCAPGYLATDAQSNSTGANQDRQHVFFGIFPGNTATCMSSESCIVYIYNMQMRPIHKMASMEK